MSLAEHEIEFGNGRSLRNLLDDLTALTHDYVVMTSAQRNAVALWVAHTHMLEAFDVSPYLDVTSPVMRCV